MLEGMSVHQIPPGRIDQAIRLLQSLQPDVVHSQDTSILTALAQVALPQAAHVITFRDPMDRHDWAIETDVSVQGSGLLISKFSPAEPLTTA